MGRSAPPQFTCLSCRHGRSSVAPLVVLLVLAVGVAVALGRSSGGRTEDVARDPISYRLGDPDAPLEVLELVDFGCGVCASFAGTTFPEVRTRFIDTGRLRWRLVPLDIGSFPNSTQAAHAAACADEQDAFWPMHDVLFAERQRWMSTGSPVGAFAEFARRLGLDEGAFAECFASDRTRVRVEAQAATARSYGVRGTPTFVIGSQVLPGAPPADEFLRRIEAVLASSR